MKRIAGLTLLSLGLCLSIEAESFRTIVAGHLDVTSEVSEGSSIELSYVDSALVGLKDNGRFLRGIELELKVPAEYLKYRGSLAIAIYTALDHVPRTGVADLKAERAGFELIPNKIQAIYQIPIRKGSGLKTSPYVSLPTGILQPGVFPILFRVMPVVKGLSADIESMKFQLTVKPVLADEGAIRLSFRYPEQLKDKPFTVYIDDNLIDEPNKERTLKDGEHFLAVLSDDYRNENRRFRVERGKIVDLEVELQDPTPVVTIEAPENTEVFFDGEPLPDHREPFLSEPGEHEVTFRVGDYSVVKRVLFLKGRTYRVALSIDVTVDEKE